MLQNHVPIVVKYPTEKVLLYYNGCIQELQLKAHCRGADWVSKTIKKKRFRQGSVISLYSEIHEDDNDLIPFILERKDDPRTKRLGNHSKARALFLILTS